MSIYTQTSGSNAVNTITLQAYSGRRYRVNWVHYSYSAAPTGGRVYIEDGATTIYDEYVTASGVSSLEFDTPIIGTAGNAMTINLDAGGGSVVSKLTASYRLT